MLVRGADVLNGQHVQVTVPAGTWMGARGEYGVYGNTMAQGDFTPAPADLASRWPHRADLITALIRPAG